MIRKGTFKGLAAGMISLAALSIGVATAEAGFPGGNGPIAFTSTRGGATDIYKMNVDGSGVTRLTNVGTNTSPAWSQDRSKIAFISNRDGNAELYVMDADGSNQTRLTTSVATESDPAFSPDNSQIAFASNAGGDRELHVMVIADAPASTQITANTTQDYAPDFSPDGSTLVYEHYAPGVDPGKGYQIMKIPTVGGTPVNLTGTSYTVENADPAFNGDGSRVVFQSRNRPAQSNWEIYTMNADGSNQTRRTNVPSAANTAPVYSPSGTNGPLDLGTPEKILFVSNRTGSSQVFVMNANGAGQTQLSDAVGSDSEPSWQALDIFPPDTSITAGPAEGATVAADNADFAIESTEAGSTFECRLDALPAVGSWGACNAAYNTGTIADGDYTLNARAIDPSGNVDPSPVTRSFTIDTTPPVVDLADGPRGPWNGARLNFTNPLFEYSSPEDSLTNVITFECRLDPPADWADCTENGSFQASGLTEGSHTFQVRGIDPWGNASAPVEVTFVVDLTEPATTIDSGPADGFWLNNGHPSYEFTADEPGTFECRISDSGQDSWAACTSPFVPSPDLADGPHTFEVRSTDQAENVESTPASRLVNVDTVAPVTTVLTGPDAETIDVDHASFTFDNDQPEDATYECNFNGGGWNACVSPFETGTINNDDYTFQVRSTDRAGNLGAPSATRSFTVYAPPRTVVTSGPAEGSHIPTGSPSFEFTSEGAGIGETPPTFECRVDSGDENDWSSCTSPLNLFGLNNGAHTVEIRAIGQGGRPDLTPVVRNFTVDKVNPTTDIVSGPAESSLTNDPTFGFASNEPGTFECSLDGGGTWTACASGVPIAAPDGPVALLVRAVDLAGNVDLSPASRNFDLDTVAPDTVFDSGLADGSRTKNTTESFAFHGTEAGSLECSVDSGDWAACSSPEELTGMSDGAQSLAVRAIDGAGNVDPSPASRSFTVDTVAPTATITNAAPAEGSIGSNQLPTFTFDSSENISPTFLCRFFDSQTDPQSVNFTACVSGVQPGAPLADETWTFQVKAVDDVGNIQADQASRTFTVDTTEPDTTIDSGPADASTVDTPAVDFTYSSSQTGSTFECSYVSTGDPENWQSCPAEGVSYTARPDGDYTFKVRATDPAGNVDSTPASSAFTIDAPPYVHILPASDVDEGETTRLTEPSFQFDSDDLAATFECRVDPVDENSPWTACSSPHATATLVDGDHTFEVRAVDGQNRPSVTPASVHFTVDSVKPATSFTVAPADGSTITDSSPDFDFTASKPGSTFECQIDGGGFSACVPPQTLGPLVDGNHTFEVKATDPIGNVEAPPAAVDFTVDTTAPVTTVTQPTEAQAFTTNQPELNFTAGEPATFSCVIDGGTPFTCADGDITAELADGAHTLVVTATDLVGNVETAPVTINFTIEAPPTVNVTSGIADGGVSNNPDQSFEFEASENDATFECRVDSTNPGDPWNVCASPVDLTGLSEGSHKFEVRAVAFAPPNDPSLKPAVRNFTVDLTKPTTDITGGPADGQTIIVDQAEFSFVSNDGGQSFECRIDSDEVADWAACSSPVALNGLDDGDHSFEVRATDQAGNVEDPVTAIDFSVDTVAPVTNITSGPAQGSSTQNPTPSFAFESSKPGSTFECRIDSDAFAPCSSPFTTAALSEGSHTLRVKATDANGLGEVTPVARTFTIDHTAPVAQITSGSSGLVNNRVSTFAFTANEASSFECKVDDGAFAACTSPFATESLADGPHSFQVRATDAAGNVSAPKSSDFEVDATAPEVTVTNSPPASSEATTATVGFNASETATFECSADGGAFVGCTSPLTLTGLAVGAHTVQIRATDAAGNVGPVESVGFEVLAPKAPGKLARPKIKVGKKRVRGGSTVKVAVTLRNTGELAVTKARACLKTPKKLISGKATRCRNVGTIAGGSARKVVFKLKARPVRKTTRASIQVTASGRSGSKTTTGTIRGHVTLIK